MKVKKGNSIWIWLARRSVIEQRELEVDLSIAVIVLNRVEKSVVIRIGD
jgi:hypothetical protein